MDIQEKENKQKDSPEMIEEFFERMSIILEKKLTMKQIHDEAEKIKKELKEKYSTQKK